MENIDSIALFDMDGTLCDYLKAMHRELKKLKCPDEPEVDPFTTKDNPKYQYLWNRMNLIKSKEEWWATLPKMKLGFDVLEIAKSLGFVCEILTRTPKENPAAYSGKQIWISKNMPKDVDFTMTQNKSRHYGRVLIDDFPPNVVAWLKYRKNAIVIMPENKYNKNFNHAKVIKYNGKNKKEIRQALKQVLRSE